MRVIVTQTLVALLKGLQHPILPTMAVHVAIKQVWFWPRPCARHPRARQYVEHCDKQNDMAHSKYRSAYVALLSVLCSKFRQDATIASMFLSDTSGQPVSHVAAFACVNPRVL